MVGCPWECCLWCCISACTGCSRLWLWPWLIWDPWAPCFVCDNVCPVIRTRELAEPTDTLDDSGDGGETGQSTARPGVNAEEFIGETVGSVGDTLTGKHPGARPTPTDGTDPWQGEDADPGACETRSVNYIKLCWAWVNPTIENKSFTVVLT